MKTARTLCHDMLREILQVIDLFLEEKSQHLAMLIDFIAAGGIETSPGAVRH
jgi:hypothetical protein